MKIKKTVIGEWRWSNATTEVIVIHPKVLDEKVVAQQGGFQRIKRWWAGVHPDKGVITKGWTGLETIEEKDKIIPIHTFAVEESSSQ